MISITFAVSALLAFAICGALVATSHWHIHYSGRREAGARHEVHEGEVTRLGGVALYLAGLICLTGLSNYIDDATAKLLWSLWACLSMIAAVGIYEDIRRNLPPLVRYFGTSFAALFFSVANGGISINSVGIEFIDALLAYKIVGVLFFVFAVSGVTHAFNLIDGQNGLSSGVAVLSYCALATVSMQTDQSALAILAITMAGANIGFLMHNYPFGRIFLGDCGAYFNGATIGALAVLVVSGNPTVSPWFALAMLIYPVWETLFSMSRRRKRGESLFQPDVEHLHHLYFIRDRKKGGLLKRSSAPRILLLTLFPVVLATLLYEHTLALIAICVLFASSYVWLYQRELGLQHVLDNSRDPA